jgi:uncharacterized protein YlaN (UPF0358 family)
MQLELSCEEVKKIKNLIDNRIEELRFDVNDNLSYNEDELQQVIRDYKTLRKKIELQMENLAVIK